MVDLSRDATQQFHNTYRHADLAEGRKIMLTILGSLPSCPIPEIAHLGKTLNQ